MKKIKSFQITELAIWGFKSFDTMQIFTFPDVTLITGANHTGKTSIADAIAFAITGVNFFGESHIDKLYCEQLPSIEVRLNFLDEDGKAHELVRKRKNDKMAISYDGYAIRQMDLSEMFGEKEIFLSIFNPLYFIEQLGDEGKQLLEKHLPFVSHEVVMNAIGEYHRTMLADVAMADPENYIKKLRTRIQELKDAITGYNAQSTLLLRQREESSQKINLLSMRQKQIANDKKALKDKQFANLSTVTLQEQLEDCTASINALVKPPPPDLEQSIKEISEVKLSLQGTQLKIYESKYADSLAEVTANHALAQKDYAHTVALVNGIHPGTKCTTCLSEISKEHLATVKCEYTLKLNEIVKNGKELQQQLNDLKVLDVKSKATFEDFRTADIEKMITKISSLEKALETKRATYKSEFTIYEAQILELKRKLENYKTLISSGNLTAEDINNLNNLMEEERQVDSDFAAQQILYKEQTDDTRKKIEEVEKDIKDINVKVTAAADYIAKRAELTFGNLAMGKVEFKLCKVLKTTGEVKDCFELTYDKRD